MPLENLLHLENLDFVDCVEHVDYEHFDYKEGKLKERGGERPPAAPLGAEEALLILDMSPAWSGGCVANPGKWLCLAGSCGPAMGAARKESILSQSEPYESNLEQIILRRKWKFGYRPG